MSSDENTPCSSNCVSSVEASESNNAQNLQHSDTKRSRKSWTTEEKNIFWKEKKLERKQRLRVRRAAKNAADQEEWENLNGEEKERRRQLALEVHARRRNREELLAEKCQTNMADLGAPRLVFDLSFSWCMTYADTKSTVSQVKFSYSSLRRAGFPLIPVITSLCGEEPGRDTIGMLCGDMSEKKALLASLKDFEGFRRFPMSIHMNEHWSSVFPKEKIVFLTADAEDVLEDLEREHIYIIGAFVDHNQHKLLSLHTAQRYGVRTARLPIKESMDVRNRCQVLTVNHVTDLLVEYLVGEPAKDWKSALEKVLPVRRVNQETLGSLRKRRREKRADSACTGRDTETA